jgi:L,D-transpeptidase ErfK/SrfK
MRGGWLVGWTVVVALAACGTRAPEPTPAPTKRYDEALFERKPLASWAIATPHAGTPPASTVVGEVRTVTVRDGDTLLDLARLYDLGYEEMVDANPGIDPWVPPVGARVRVPTAFVLPCCSYDGLVVNVPELRVFFYRPGSKPDTTIVETYPLALGRNEYPTPTGVFHVKGKTVNPGWGVPARIRAEHIRERGDARTFIRGGDPDNPLGKYRFELDRTLYRIHGTNMPWGIGRLVSHGCAQLYPEDMAHLFPLVPVGTRVEFLYQPVKVGRRDGVTWIEAHRDIYRRGVPSLADMMRTLQAKELPAEPSRVEAALRDRTGVPTTIGGRSPWWAPWKRL